MVDIVDSATRSRMMSGIRGRNTKPEILIRSLLHRQGFRFRLDARDPGARAVRGRKEDVFAKYGAPARAVLTVRTRSTARLRAEILPTRFCQNG